ncbi:MAG: ribulose-phosphate 3-epimerase [Candidatus Cloacimonetes bacterium HGW-Cloacimonetes-1]|jgi:ribulose-phosphate 3-epimerase|nr:MAG: ribulose-phosphate 3-epimerase [Candidatus Cloacimonetes bacterium HGW-Cloacimonetes-1]
MKNTIIAPSILSCDFGRLHEEIQALEIAGADLLHLDVMDGHYVPNLTFGIPFIKFIRKYSELPLDVHLMVSNPGAYVDELCSLGVNWISFHQDTEPHSHRLIHKIQDMGVKAGIAINPAIGLTSLEAIMSDLDYVLLMSVNPGFSGQQFIETTVEKTRLLKSCILQNQLNTKIEIDGGVNATNAQHLIDAGADILVSASYIFSHTDYAEPIRRLKNV